MGRFLNVFLLLGLSLFLSCSPHILLTQKQKKTIELKKEISFLLKDPSIANAHVGIYVESIKEGKVLYARNPFKLMVPASNMKLFTTATALVKLGPDFRFRTKIGYRGTLIDSVLNGDLIIIGAGDPSISGKFYNNDRLAIFKNWADSLKTKGIKTINGQIIADESFFKDPKLGEGWDWDDEPYWYCAKISALALNDNCVDIAVWPDSFPGESVHVQMFPQYDKIKIINKAKTVKSTIPQELQVTRLHGRDTILVTGAMNVNADTLWESISVEHPVRYFLDVLKETLQQEGIRCNREVRIAEYSKITSKDSLKLLFVHQSPPLSELIKVVNKISHNFYAEQILKTLGARFKGEGSFQAGAAVVHDFLNSIGVADDHFINVDGSGLSRKNFIAPVAMATLLRYMYFHPYFKYFLASLPIAGVDGTIKNRMQGSSAQGRVHAKTGYVQHMRALSGYTNLDGTNPILFVMLFNNYSVPTPKINLIQDRIAILLSNF